MVAMVPGTADTGPATKCAAGTPVSWVDVAETVECSAATVAGEPDTVYVNAASSSVCLVESPATGSPESPVGMPYTVSGVTAGV